MFVEEFDVVSRLRRLLLETVSCQMKKKALSQFKIRQALKKQRQDYLSLSHTHTHTQTHTHTHTRTHTHSRTRTHAHTLLHTRKHASVSNCDCCAFNENNFFPSQFSFFFRRLFVNFLPPPTINNESEVVTTKVSTFKLVLLLISFFSIILFLFYGKSTNALFNNHSTVNVNEQSLM